MRSESNIQFPTISFSAPISVAHRQLLINFEGITNRFGNDFVEPNWGSSEGRGRYIGFQTRFLNPDGTQRVVKNAKHSTILRWIDPEHTDYDSKFTDEILITGHYQLGFHILPVYVNIEQILRFLEVKYNFDVNYTPDRCFTWPHAYNTYESPISSEWQSVLKTMVRLYSQVCNKKNAWSQSFFPVTYQCEDGRDSKKLTENESKILTL